MNNKRALVFDIETIGRNFDDFDELTQSELKKRLTDLDPTSEEYAQKLNDIKNSLGLSPLTGEIVAIGMYDCEREQGIVLYQAPGEDNQAVQEGDFTYIQKTETEMLKLFWEKAKEYDEFISFYGRGFDAPWLMMRSAIHKIRMSKNIMDGRYLYQQKGGAQHIDLADLLTFYGSANLPGKSLHMYCQAFGIQSPKGGNVSGNEVGKAFQEKRFLEIAQYNAADLSATRALFNYWNEYLRF